MAGEFDIRKLTEAFKTQVDNAMSEGKARVADKKEDYKALAMILAGLDEKQTNERAFVQSKMDEYNAKYKLDDLRDRASEYVRATVDNFKSMFKPKKELNADEADHLLVELEKAHNEGRNDDIEYIIAELENAGFKEKLTEYYQKHSSFSEGPITTTPIEKVETHKESKEESAPNKKEDLPEQAPVKPKTPVKPKVPVNPKPPVKPVEPEYNERQKDLINRMSERIDLILENRNAPGFRQSLIDGTTRLLNDAKALGLNDTKEYKTLKQLNDNEIAAIKPEQDAKKQAIISKMKAMLANNPIKFRLNIKEAKAILKKAADMGLQHTSEYKDLQNRIDNAII